MSDWYPQIWLRWGDALAEAGYAPNQLQARASNEALIEKYIRLIRELGKLPVEGEIENPNPKPEGIFAGARKAVKDLTPSRLIANDFRST